MLAVYLCVKKSTSAAISTGFIAEQNTILQAKQIINQKNSRFNRNWTGLITNASRMKKQSILTWNGFMLLTVTDILIQQPF